MFKFASVILAMLLSVGVFPSDVANGDVIDPVAHVHAYSEWTIVVEPTCTEAGTQTRSCPCGDEQTKTIKALGHNFGSWKINREASITETGLQKRGCAACNAKDTKTLPKLTAPKISGAKTQTLKLNYTKTSTKAFTITGNPEPKVRKTKGSEKITWNAKTKKLDIARGLKTGKYPVTLKASSKAGSKTFEFTLLVEKQTAKPSAKAIPKSKSVVKNTKITLTAPKGVTLYYSINGEKPTTKTGTKIAKGESKTVKIKKDTTLKVTAKKSGHAASEVVTRKYTLYTSDQLSAALASLTKENGQGEIAFAMPKSKVKKVLNNAEIKYKETQLTITFADGTGYAFSKANGEETLDHFYFTQSPKGLKVGDKASQVEKIYGKSKRINFNGAYFYRYTSGKMETLVVMSSGAKNAVVSQICLNYKSFNVLSKNDGINATGNARPVAKTTATAHNAQKKVRFKQGITKKEKFVQIAESQVGYASGQAVAGGIRFPFEAVSGWTKYSQSYIGIGEMAWCACFVSWCADRADISKSKLKRSTWAEMNKENLTPRGKYSPKRGDLIHFSYREKSVKEINHIGIVTGVKNGFIYTVEGNGRNSGNRGYTIAKAYRLDNIYIKGTSRF